MTMHEAGCQEAIRGENLQKTFEQLFWGTRMF
jgi:hypothetical protein